MAQVSTVDTRSHFNYLYAHFYQLNVEDFVVEVHHSDILYFSFHS